MHLSVLVQLCNNYNDSSNEVSSKIREQVTCSKGECRHTPGFRTRRTLSFLSAKYLDTEFLQSYKLGLLQHSLHLSHSVPAVNQNSKVASSSGWASMAFNWSAHLLFRGQ